MPRLDEALTLGRSDVVAFVGAGGKTTAMFRLARELRANGMAIVTTTTTKILVPVAEDRVGSMSRPDGRPGPA